MRAIDTGIAAGRSAKQALKLEYFTGDTAVATLDEARIGADLSSGVTQLGSLSPFFLAGHEHVATASVGQAGNIVGFIGASRLLTSSEPVLLVEQVRIHQTHQNSSIIRRLVAMIMLRMAGVEGVPAALAIRASDGRMIEAFLSLSRHFTGAVCYPPPAYEPVAYASALLARRIASAVAPSLRYELATSTLRGARLAPNYSADVCEAYGTSTAISRAENQSITPYDERLVVIDLRSEDETTLIDDARQVYRNRRN